MRGNVKLTLEITNAMGTFPITETFTIEQNNTYESFDEWIEAFKKILYFAGFNEAQMLEVFNEEE